jgi:subtilisin family serine protease
MKKIKTLFKPLLLIVVMLFLFVTSCTNEEGEMQLIESEALVGFSSEPIDGQFIITLEGESVVRKSNLKYKEGKKEMKKEILAKFANIALSEDEIIHTYGHTLHGFAAKLNKQQLETLKKDKRVKRIEQDQLVTLAKPEWAGGGGDDPVAVQTTPWGITRVKGGVSGVGKTAWVIDSGIDLDHPDLEVDVDRSRSFLGGKDANDPDDANGHGTHVAGTIAALDNEEGVIGVAAGATVISVRVLNRRGSGSFSGVIAGVEYVGANGEAGDVANMSLGGGVSEALDQAVKDASNVNGVIFCLAAGNESDDANNHSPARAEGNNIVTVSASDINDNFASYSNYGNPPIDWCAPGSGIESTWKNGGYNTISGTSMATPHVAGVLLLNPNVSTNGLSTVKGDVNGDGSPDTIIEYY